MIVRLISSSTIYFPAFLSIARLGRKIPIIL